MLKKIDVDFLLFVVFLTIQEFAREVKAFRAPNVVSKWLYNTYV